MKRGGGHNPKAFIANVNLHTLIVTDRHSVSGSFTLISSLKFPHPIFATIGSPLCFLILISPLQFPYSMFPTL